MSIPPSISPEKSSGLSVHSALQKVVNVLETGKVPGVEDLGEILRGVWVGKGYASEEDEREEFRKLAGGLGRFMELQMRMKGRVVAMEKWFTVVVCQRMFVGRIDRIDSVDGKFRVIDYKTSSRDITRDELRRDIQMYIYGRAVEYMYGEIPEEICIWNLRTGNITCIPFSEMDHEKIEDNILLAVKGIESGDFHPVRSHYCDICDYREICRGHGTGGGR